MLFQSGSRPKFFRKAAVAVLAGSAWLATAGTALAQNSDSTIQASVMSAISNDSALHGQNISATAANGVVTLAGTVQTDAQSQQAETDAANVSGVSGILNHLNVTNPGPAAPAAGLSAQTSADQLSPQDQTTAPPPPDETQQQVQGSVPPPPPDVAQPQSAPQGYGAPGPAYQPGYGYAPQQGYPNQSVPYYATPSGPVTIPAGTLLRVRLSEPLDTRNLKAGAFFQATSAIDVYQNGVLAIPRGAVLTGQIVEAKNAGELGGSAILRLQLTNVNLNGKIFPLTSDVWSSKGPNKAGYTAGNTAGGALLGALIGGIIGRGAGAGIGAAVGGVGGLAASSATNGPRVYLPVEAQVDFHLTNPATVQPVPWQEAQRLASSVPQPVLVQRPRPVYVVPGPYYGPYPYGYPYPY